MLGSRLHELRVGRKGHRLRLHDGVDDDPGKVRELRRLGARGNRKALLDRGAPRPSAGASASATDQRSARAARAPRRRRTGNGVLDPARAQIFVGEIRAMVVRQLTATTVPYSEQFRSSTRRRQARRRPRIPGRSCPACAAVPGDTGQQIPRRPPARLNSSTFPFVVFTSCVALIAELLRPVLL
jgi:hypothetical protein